MKPKYKHVDRAKPKRTRSTRWGQHGTGRFRTCARCDKTFEETTRRRLTCEQCYVTNSA